MIQELNVNGNGQRTQGLTLFQYEGANIRFQNRDGVIWVSLTDMAKATGKKVSHWNQLNSTKEYIDALESVAGIPATETIQGGVATKQGTWAIKQVAIDFAQWCNVDFRIWVNQKIDELMTKGWTQLEDFGEPPEPPKVKLTNDDADLLRNILSSVDKSLVDGFLLNEMERYQPELKGTLDEAHKLLTKTTDIPEVFLTPTVIGQRLTEITGHKISARKVNLLLIEMGLQYRTPKEEKSKGVPDYQITLDGEEFGQMTMATGSRGDNTTFQHLKWLESVVDRIFEYYGDSINEI